MIDVREVQSINFRNALEEIDRSGKHPSLFTDNEMKEISHCNNSYYDFLSVLSSTAARRKNYSLTNTEYAENVKATCKICTEKPYDYSKSCHC